MPNKLGPIYQHFKTFLPAVMSALFVALPVLPSFAAEMQSYVQPPMPESKLLLKGEVTYLVPKGTPIKLKLASVPTSGLKLFDRDMEGNLRPAQLGQEITAKITQDLYVEENKVIPEGTVFYGMVSRIHPPKRVGRPGSLELTFEYFKTPDGRKFAFHVEANNAKESTTKSKLKGLGIIAAHTAGGAVTGAIVAYQIFGLENTIAMHGYNIAGAAAGGALAGTVVALMRHGPEAVLEPGDDLNMEIDSDLLLPATTTPTKRKDVHLEGLDIEILKSKVLKDGLGGHILRLEAEISNNTPRRLNSIDLFLEDDNGSRFPISASGADWESELLFQVDPHTICRKTFYFQLEYPKLKRKLVWIDHESRQMLAKQPLP